MKKISIDRQERIRKLRLVGKSIPEIVTETGFAKTTVQRYVLNVKIPEKYHQILKEKQGGSKDRAKGLRENMLSEASYSLGTLSVRDIFLITTGLYWGEGTKRDFEMINSDPRLLQTFLVGLYSLGIPKQRIAFSLRVHSDISVKKAKEFWSRTTGLPEQSISRIEIIEGKKKGKLRYGMCRIRVLSGVRERLLIQSAISLIGKESSKRLVSNSCIN